MNNKQVGAKNFTFPYCEGRVWMVGVDGQNRQPMVKDKVVWSRPAEKSFSSLVLR